MEKAKSFRDLLVWQRAHELVLEVYKVTQHYPTEERFGLKPLQFQFGQQEGFQW